MDENYEAKSREDSAVSKDDFIAMLKDGRKTADEFFDGVEYLASEIWEFLHKAHDFPRLHQYVSNLTNALKGANDVISLFKEDIEEDRL